MTDEILQKVRINNYFNLLRHSQSDILAICIFDAEGELVMHDDQASSDALTDLKAYVSSHSPKTWISGRGVQRRKLGEKRIVQNICLYDDLNNPLAGLVVLSTRPGFILKKMDFSSLDDSMNTIADCLQTELRLIGELEGMALELTERYEELNLIYESDTHRLGIYQGQESLQQLIEACTNYLDVGVTALILNEKEIALYHFHQERPIQNAHWVLPSLNGDVFRWVKKNKQPIVVNHQSELLGLEVCPDIPYKLLACPVISGESSVIGMLVVINHIDKPDYTNGVRKLLQVIANRVSYIIQINFDSLTGLENLYSYEWYVKKALADTRLHSAQHAILDIDIDGLRIVNDIHGREAGDALICNVGEILRKLTRSSDVVARIGGDEFGVLLDNCSIETAANLAKNIRDEISSANFEWKGEIQEMTVTIGVAPITLKSESVADVLSAVEVARSAAMERGRNRINVFKQNNIDLLRRRDEMQWVGRIQSAIRENRLQLYGQIIQPLRPGIGLPHYEILLRMLGEDGEQIIPPGRFIPAAEHYHLMPAIDRWVVEHVFDSLAQRTNPSDVSINLSGQSLSDLEFQEFIIDELEQKKISPNSICFEITESAAIANLEEAKQFIAAIKQKGCRFSLDDFGTGLSSFSYLQNLDVDYLKIDGSFVKLIHKDNIAKTMVSAINQVGHAMGIQTIAEYAENEEIIMQLKKLQVDFGQGYGLGKPELLEGILEAPTLLNEAISN